MREIEIEIDQAITNLPFWDAPQEALLELILEFHRDAIEAVFMQIAWARLFRPDDLNEITRSFVAESYIRAGVFQILKWTMEFAQGSERDSLPNNSEIQNLIGIGRQYEILVDMLKMANHHQVAIEIDDGGKIITIYEGEI